MRATMPRRLSTQNGLDCMHTDLKHLGPPVTLCQIAFHTRLPRPNPIRKYWQLRLVSAQDNFPHDGNGHYWLFFGKKKIAKYSVFFVPNVGISGAEQCKLGWFPLRKTFLRTGTDRKISFVLEPLVPTESSQDKGNFP